MLASAIGVAVEGKFVGSGGGYLGAVGVES
jgi:hypothetical protein